ncbi:hypothetical protein OHB26_03695 [Nocardia sp. NBC_01503]|uniref:hypothetical protein n=1 Tax=Nocardia sp. NBC_01503 TaxID=2975997 RepID=UPI002E7B2D32|nr:hypothetical protein [Nocardia sp. NBC_01503]WTL33360.1 hypothetical protein OHB26_03695 [Nocardia sp. NBC_01503]
MTSAADEPEYMGWVQNHDGTWAALDPSGFQVPVDAPDVDELISAGLVELRDFRVIDVEPISVQDTEIRNEARALPERRS